MNILKEKFEYTHPFYLDELEFHVREMIPLRRKGTVGVALCRHCARLRRKERQRL